MKHSLKITLYLIILFFASQTIGLYLLNSSIEEIKATGHGKIEVKYSEPVTGRPDLKGQESFNYIIVMVLAGTALLFLLIKFRLFKIWKAWFFLAVFSSLNIAFSVFMPHDLAFLAGLILAFLKLYKYNAIIHNLTEIFIYAGITIMISPLFSVYYAGLLLVAISLYDAFAVWKSRHMVTLAEAQAKNRVFAGLLINYEKKTKKSKNLEKIGSKKGFNIKRSVKKAHYKSDKTYGKAEKKQETQSSNAILGGGDIAFPMVFSGSVMTFLIEKGLSKQAAFFNSTIISVFSAIALFVLFIKSKKGKYYPAMPFITIGCFIGYGAIMLINFGF